MPRDRSDLRSRRLGLAVMGWADAASRGRVRRVIADVVEGRVIEMGAQALEIRGAG